jgi:hypothetical protein
MWINNSGATKFNANPRTGIETSAFFILDGSFALWFDSVSSFRVYVYAKKNVDATSSPSVFLPLNQWVNI